MQRDKMSEIQAEDRTLRSDDFGAWQVAAMESGMPPAEIEAVAAVRLRFLSAAAVVDEVLGDTRTQTASFAAAAAAFWELYAQPFDVTHLLLMSRDNKQINAYRYGSQPGERDYLGSGSDLTQ
ncbi:hypothetical protein ACMHYJ_03495 [Castellaniella hirudinis]|uniref:hypothetical protein n=1 Tax=Castellaniella hirudinis TaxID=1144617 RepID=UPI0039C29F57